MKSRSREPKLQEAEEERPKHGLWIAGRAPDRVPGRRWLPQGLSSWPLSSPCSPEGDEAEESEASSGSVPFCAFPCLHCVHLL